MNDLGGVLLSGGSTDASNIFEIYPVVIFIGPMKTGTTSIYALLKKDPRICLPTDVKETFFFDRYFDRGIAWYASQFRPQKRTQVLVEVAPSLFHNIDAPARLAAFGVKALIISLRDPVDRSISHYRHLRRYGFVNSLEECVRSFPEVYRASQYSMLIPEWSKVCDSEPTLVDLFEKPTELALQLSKIWNAIGLGNCPFSPREIRNENRHSQSIFIVAKFSRLLATELRRREYYSIIGFFKRLGLKKILFGRGGVGAQYPGNREKDEHELGKHIGLQVYPIKSEDDR